MTFNFRVQDTLYRLAWRFGQVVNTLQMHPFRAMQWDALNETVGYIKEHMHEAIGQKTQSDVLITAIEEAQKVKGDFLEFGVFRGDTIRLLGKRAGPGRTVHGFDSFEGLPEAWAGHSHEKGRFNVSGQLPKVEPNTKLHKGWFDSSIPTWKKQHDAVIALLHVDCDLYSSTKTIFDELGERLQPGSVIVFDEYFNYPHWKRHEYKAFQELIAQRDIKYTYLAYARYQVAVRIDHIRTAD